MRRDNSSSANFNPTFAAQEALAFACISLQIRFKELRRPYKPLTSVGRFNHYIVGPLFRWKGQNDRIVTTQPLSQVGIQDKNGSTRTVINGSSYNYAGFYELTPEDEALQRKCLDQLPFADAESVPLLNTLMLESLAKFFDSDCCYSTTTGYQANMLGIPAIVREDWLIAVDEKSHNSIFTAMYAARAGARQRFNHNDMTQLQSILEAAQSMYSNILVVVEGLYSMDGTTPPLDALVQLKRKFGFVLYVDEAHSFGAIGKTGRGCLEMWNDLHPQNPIPVDVIDIRSAVLSKAVGGLGGFVCATARFSDNLRKRAEELQKRGESLTTSTMLQTMTFLLQPLRLSRHLHRLSDISRFCHDELERQGVRIYGDVNVPMLPIYGGRPSKASELSYVLRKLGLVASPVSAPPVEIWGSRVRVTLSASYSDDDVNQLIDAIVGASQQVGLSRPNKLPRRVYCYEDRNGTPKLQKESQETQQYLDSLLRHQIEQLPVKRTHAVALFEANCGRSIIEVGHSARQQYGLGSGSARWIPGTFQPHTSTSKS